MPERECGYVATNGVKANLSQSLIDDLVKRTVNEIYDNNLNLQEQVYTKRYQIWTVSGKVANGGEILNALKHFPKEVNFLLPIVCVSERKGEDSVFLLLQSEILDEKNDLYKLMSMNEIRSFVNKPPKITVEDLVAQSR